MKKIFILLLIFPLLTIAQNHFKELEQKESINKIIVDSNMLELMANIEMNSNNNDSKEYQKLIKSIDNLKIYIDESGKHKIKMKQLFYAYANKNGLKEQNVNNNKLTCYTKKGKKEETISELLIYTKNINKQNESIIIYINGDFKLKQAETLIKNLKITGAKLFSNIQ